MKRYFIESRTRKYIKGYGFCHSWGIYPTNNKYGGKILATATKTGLDAAKTAFKKVYHKTAEATGELVGNKIAVPDENSRNVEEIVFWPEKRQELLNKYYKMKHHKISKLLNDSTASKF